MLTMLDKPDDHRFENPSILSTTNNGVVMCAGQHAQVEDERCLAFYGAFASGVVGLPSVHDWS
jgi:hypothetical protein